MLIMKSSVEAFRGYGSSLNGQSSQEIDLTPNNNNTRVLLFGTKRISYC